MRLLKLIQTIGAIVVLSSCCNPYVINRIDPLFLENHPEFKRCYFSPCNPSDPNCEAYFPLNLTLGYESLANTQYSIGLNTYGYSRSGVMILGVNSYYNSFRNYSSFSIDLQKGLFPLGKLGIPSLYLGTSFQYFNEKHSGWSVKPNIGFTLPYRYVNALQFQYGYYFPRNNEALRGNYFGVKYSIPLPIFKT